MAFAAHSCSGPGWLRLLAPESECVRVAVGGGRGLRHAHAKLALLRTRLPHSARCRF